MFIIWNLLMNLEKKNNILTPEEIKLKNEMEIKKKEEEKKEIKEEKENKDNEEDKKIEETPTPSPNKRSSVSHKVKKKFDPLSETPSGNQ